MGIVGMAMAVAPAIGPTLGGLQTDMNGWRSIFLTLTVIGCISILLAVFGLHNFGESDKTAHADFFSVGLSIIGLWCRRRNARSATRRGRAMRGGLSCRS